jgi:hypothetical protein
MASERIEVRVARHSVARCFYSAMTRRRALAAGFLRGAGRLAKCCAAIRGISRQARPAFVLTAQSDQIRAVPSVNFGAGIAHTALTGPCPL